MIQKRIITSCFERSNQLLLKGIVIDVDKEKKKERGGRKGKIVRGDQKRKRRVDDGNKVGRGRCFLSRFRFLLCPPDNVLICRGLPSQKKLPRLYRVHPISGNARNVICTGTSTELSSFVRPVLLRR